MQKTAKRESAKRENRLTKNVNGLIVNGSSYCQEVGMKKIKIGIIGCGLITREAHLPAVKRLTDKLDVIAVCNRSEGKAINIANELGIPLHTVWTDWKEMIQEVKDLEAVLVALPIPLNYSVSKACCKAGLSVLCEKPAGISVEEAVATGDFSLKYGVTFMTAENFHYQPKFNKAAELIQEEIIGKLHSISWNVLNYVKSDNNYNQTAWRGADFTIPGGYVLDGGVHAVHALQMIAGPVKSVFAKVKSIDKNLGSIDTAFALLEHENSVVTSLNLGWKSLNDDKCLKLYGDKGTLAVRDDKIEQLTLSGETVDHFFDTENDFFLQWSDFLDALQNNRPPKIPKQMPIDDVKIIMAILESGETGEKVFL